MDETDARALTDLGNVLLEFHENGDLICTTRGHEKDQIIKLRYSVEGTTIITDQPSKPRLERTQFSLTDDMLTLVFGGLRCRFVRAR